MQRKILVSSSPYQHTANSLKWNDIVIITISGVNKFLLKTFLSVWGDNQWKYFFMKEKNYGTVM